MAAAVAVVPPLVGDYKLRWMDGGPKNLDQSPQWFDETLETFVHSNLDDMIAAAVFRYYFKLLKKST